MSSTPIIECQIKYSKLKEENEKLKDYLAEHQSAANLYDMTMNRLEAENAILKEREDGLNHALKLANAEIDRLHKALEAIIEIDERYSDEVLAHERIMIAAKQALK